MTLWPLLLAACGGDPVADALAPGPEDPAAMLAACDAMAFEELAIPCRVAAAAEAARRGDESLAETACAGLPEGPWPGECHFRVGEEMARAGDPHGAARHCGRADVFARSCFTHAASLLAPPKRGPGPEDPAVTVQAIGASLATLEVELHAQEGGDRAEALEGFRARLWFNAYYGSGRADPAAARLAPESLAPHARTAWALEAVRLLFPEDTPLPADALVRARAAWTGAAPIPEGERLPPDQRVGRYATPLPVPGEPRIAHVPVFGGGMRVVGADADEDLDLALLEALFFRRSTLADDFAPWVDDPRERVRRTAVRLLRRSPGRSLDMPALFARLASSPDPVLRWHAAEVARGPGPRPGESPRPGGPP